MTGPWDVTNSPTTRMSGMKFSAENFRAYCSMNARVAAAGLGFFSIESIF